MKSGAVQIVLVLITVLSVSCGPAATQAPTQPPATEAPATEAPTAAPTEAPTSPALKTVCASTPDGQGEYAGKNPKPTSTTILGLPHGFYVYRDVQNVINKLTGSPQSTVLSSPNVVILVIDVFSSPDVPKENTEFNANFPNYPWLKRIDSWEAPNGAITLVAVDTDELNTVSISRNMKAALDLFGPSDVVLGDVTYPKADSIVVNMSYAYIPCDPIPYIKPSLNLLSASNGLNLTEGDMESVSSLRAVYDKGSGTPFYDYINSTWPKDHPNIIDRLKIYSDTDDAIFEAFITFLVYSPDDLKIDNESFSRFQQQNSVDPNNPSAPGWLQQITLNNLIAEHSSARFIGAAGNFGFPYPFYPAAYDAVISVSSDGAFILEDTCRKDIADYSNCGEVKIDGAHFANSSIQGTSFAAPKFSSWVAWYLLGHDLCPVNPNLLPNGLDSLNNNTWDNANYLKDCQP